MLKHLLNRLLHSVMGRKNHGYHHYSSSNYKKGYNHPINRPPYSPKGHGYYKKKYSSYSS